MGFSRIWQSFRALPLWVQATVWLVFWPLLAPVLLWQWRRWEGVTNLLALVVLLLGLPWLASLFGVGPRGASQSTPRSLPRMDVATTSPRRAASPIPTGAPLTVPQVGVVDRVVDGDTLRVRIDRPGGPLEAGATYVIRLLEVDAPETLDPDTPVECWGAEAAGFAERSLTADSPVYLVGHRQDTDQYGRHLRYVWSASGVLFNEEAVRRGFARVSAPPSGSGAEGPHLSRLKAAEAEARRARRGMWGPPCNWP